MNERWGGGGASVARLNVWQTVIIGSSDELGTRTRSELDAAPADHS